MSFSVSGLTQCAVVVKSRQKAIERPPFKKGLDRLRSWMSPTEPSWPASCSKASKHDVDKHVEAAWRQELAG